VDYRILGSLEVAAGGHAVELGPPKQRALLAVLLLHANEVVVTERLIELVWGGRQPRTAAHSVQMYVSELRRRLSGVGASRSVIETRAPGYVLHAEPDAVDAWRFERLVAEGSAQVRSGQAEAGKATLRAALGLWRGEPLSEFAYDEFALPYIRRLEELRWHAVEELSAAELVLGLPADALADLAPLVETEPLRERARELELRALYRCGRQADALRVYDGFRRRLADELGIDPSPALQQLQGRILLQDPGLAPSPMAGHGGVRNPFKGLRAFTEADAGDFFGRRRLVEQLCAKLADGLPLVAVVGPSGCGKSSVVAAGLVPGLRADAVPGSKAWLIAAMVPGARPADELQAALAVASERLVAHGAGTRRLATAVADLPSETTLLVVIDQFEELFSLADGIERSAFIADLTGALLSAGGRLRVVVSLRADFYDRPLLEPALARLFTAGAVDVLPPAAEDLEAAVIEPAGHADVAVEPALLAELVADAVGQPGALPLFQYTLTELFDRREGATVTLASYRQLGGLRRAVSRRAEDLYRSLTPGQQRVAEQVFLRLVILGEGTKDTRRRVGAVELGSLELDPVDLAEVLERFGRHRLLTFDRDPVTGDATVEVAHEALLFEWGRLSEWIDGHRADLRAHQALVVAVTEWQAADQDPDYLLAGTRLARHDTWSQDTDLQLTATEKAFLDASRVRRRTEQEADAARRAQEARLSRRARNRLFALFSVLVLLTAAGTALVLALAARRSPDVALVFDGRGPGGFSQMIAAGFDEAVTEFGLVAEEVAPISEARLRLVSGLGVPLIIVSGSQALEGTTIPADHPDTAYAFIDWQGEAVPNITYTRFAEEQGSFLVGAAAALTTEAGSVGFIGGVDTPLIWKFQAGFEAGVHHVDPDIEIRSVYLSRPPDFSGFGSPTLAAHAATEIYRSGADVIYHAAGTSGFGLLETAVAESRAQGRHLWAIGVDVDEYANETDTLWEYGPADWRPHVLTSMIKRLDVAVYRTIKDFAHGTFVSGERILGLAEEGIDYATSGGFVDDIVPDLEQLKRDIIDGRLQVPTVPAS
jgi:basic membrane lipoprotein Med (substrate-binding protein (PBP1-ABC) superfamily)/DNA-binding SARP family transcriptional activator